MARASPVPDAFRSELAALKRDGCVVLVAGQVPADLVDDLSARLLGDAAAADRTRLLGLLDRTVGRARTRLALASGCADCRVVTTAAGRTAAVVDPATDPASVGVDDGGRTTAGDGPGPTDAGPGCGGDSTRDGAATSDDPTTTGSEPPATGDGSGGVGDGPDGRLAVERVDGVRRFVGALPAAVDDLAAGRGAFAAGELRVCVDSLRPLVTVDGVDHRSFVATVREAMRRRRGLAHFVLPVPADGEVAAALSPLFDVVVSLRTRDAAEQRWHLPDAGYRTDWVRYSGGP